ncbi:NAD(P)/FAD-dependent oxidoreductase [Solirubrobacter soli]|uniref:NAD(P)/FAD-dependent oxidoreductase n=1 Tax=Solirubrobacter soli TaxID=363832 RepID=UPI00041C1D88|nr:FAD-dependent oxidoreductase [Solirubrobacter soli]
MRVLIAGGGPAALATARAYRGAGGDGDVTLITPEAALPYQRPPLSKDFLRGEATEDDLPIEPADWYSQNEVTVVEDAVVEVGDHEVVLRRETLGFDRLVLATGARPKRIGNGLVLRSLADARTLRAAAETADAATVIGSGFIGCEAAASLAMRGLDVTLVSDEDIPHAARLGEEAGRRITGFLSELGIRLKLGEQAQDTDGLRLEAVGVESPRIPVDEHMRSKREDVFAVGDAALAHNARAGRPLPVEHWGEALNMGEVAGRVLAGEDARWDVAPGFWSTIGDHTLKYVAWGDGYDEVRVADHGHGAWAIWYGTGGVTVGVLTHERDGDYERGRALIEGKEPLP